MEPCQCCPREVWKSWQRGGEAGQQWPDPHIQHVAKSQWAAESLEVYKYIRYARPFSK